MKTKEAFAVNRGDLVGSYSIYFVQIKTICGKRRGNGGLQITWPREKPGKIRIYACKEEKKWISAAWHDACFYISGSGEHGADRNKEDRKWSRYLWWVMERSVSV
ncbi:hypothetical protein [Bacilliculturomica massiliensis]|uniref:hypothetical protein n=1 Tax=Bacilliculturomica massiliensis TaxID=1917867 RepID=UPI001031591E|nr:hypothetical protein [Bacilliculturomica massiliensis]